MNRIRNLFTSFGIAAAFAAIILVGTSGIASAADPIPANVHLNVDSHFVQGLKPANILTDWYVTVYPLGTNTMTLSAASMYEREPDLQGQTLNWAGDHFGGAGIETGKMMLKGHFGENGDFVAGPVDIGVGNPYTLNANFVAMGSYKPFPVGAMPTTNTGTKPGTAAAKPAVKAAAKAAPVVLTPLCSAILPLAQTGGKAYVLKTGPFQGKVAFVLATNASVLSVEAAEHMFKASGSNAAVRDFTDMDVGDAVEIPSGAYQVFNVESNQRLTPLGFLNAHPVTQPANQSAAQAKVWVNNVAIIALDRPNATCRKYPIDMLAADPGRTGSNDLPGGLAGIVLAGTLGIAMLFYFLVLPMLKRRRQSAVMVIG